MKRASNTSSFFKASLWTWILFHFHFKGAEASLTQENLPYDSNYWLQEENARPLKGYFRENPGIGGPEDFLNLQERVNLSDKPKISHGPRKRSLKTYYDPIFKIPLASSPQAERLREEYDFCLQVDCFIFVDHDCCTGKIRRSDGPDRIYPIGPFVEPTLLENWVSGLLAFWMENPMLFSFIKKLSLGILLLSLSFAWGLFGHKWGFLSHEGPFSRADDQVNELTQRIVIALDHEGDNSIPSWMEQLRQVVENKKAYKDVSNFLCCFFEEDEGKRRSPRGYLACHPARNRWRKFKYSTSCVSKLIYKLTLNKDP